jgi:hypothetical protein
VFIVMNTNKSTSRWQGREGDQTSEGSRSAKVRDGASPGSDTGDRNRIQGLVAGRVGTTQQAHRFMGQGKCGGCARKVHVFPVWAGTSLIWRVTREIPGEVYTVEQSPGIFRCRRRVESLWETQNRQQPIIFSIRPFSEIWRPSIKNSPCEKCRDSRADPISYSQSST